MKQYQFILLLALFFLPFHLLAQSSKVVSDFRTRTTFKAEKELLKNITGFAEFELGLEQDISRIGKLHGEAGVGYTPAKYLDLEAKYRFTKNRKNYSENYKLTHTYAFSVQYSKRFDLLKCYLRLQFKNIDDEALQASSIDKLRNIIKPRLKAKYDIWGTRFSPYVLSEFYFSTHEFSYKTYKIKNIIGVEYTFFNKNELELYYRNDRELNSYLPYTYHTIGVGYCIKF
ncbi:MAG: DUF2490 domain-containing protein [Prolixibacteraceae bacterium]|jgi:hypothetical protein|nr:DUF2490 domain-containing protein [Prolixibacteraceae bacterium]